MITAFTGTRRRWTSPQRDTVTKLVQRLRPFLERIHDGACHGSDREFWDLVHTLYPDIPFEFHPCKIEQYEWADRVAASFDTVHAIDEDPIRRNHRMVNRSKFTIATPAQTFNVPRGSGTWATIRFTRKVGKPLYVCWPDGTLLEESGIYEKL